MAATGGAGGRAASWTKGKIVGLIVAALFAAGLIAVIVVGVRDPDAFKAKGKDATTTNSATTTKTLSDNTNVESAAPVAKAPIKTTPVAPATTTTTPATPTTPAAKPAAPAAPVQNSAIGKVGALLGGGAPAQDSKFATFMETMGKAQVNVQEAAKNVLAATPYSAACTPMNGPDLLKAVNEQKCTYITLGRNVTYLMPKGSQMDITSTVVIVGDAAMRPIINAAKAQRAFHVHSEGYLQVSFVEIYRGNEYVSGDFIYTRGGSMLADFGAGATFIGVVFGQPTASMYASDVREQLVLGGHLLVLGGEIFITGCTFLNVNPLALRFPIFMGGDELVVNGYVYETATTHTQFSGIIIGAGSGVFVSIINGMGVYTGVAFTRAVVAASAGGYGLQAGIVGGIGIFTGCTITSNIALLAFYGAGAQQFLGGGVLVNTGVESIGAFGAGFPVGLAPFVTVGGGVFISTGATYNVNAGAQFISVTGGITFLGGGVANMVGTNFVRSLGLAAAYGLAGQHFQGGGTAQFIGGGNSLQTGVAGGWFLGGQFYMGGGNMIEVAQPSSRNHPVVYRQGQGNHVWMGGGMYVCTGTPDSAFSPKKTTYAPPWQKRFWVSNYATKNGNVEDSGMYWTSPGWKQAPPPFRTPAPPGKMRWLGAEEDTKVYDANVFHDKARKLSEYSATQAQKFLTRQGEYLMGTRSTVCVDSRITGNDEECDQGVLGMEQVDETTACKVNFDRPECPAGSPNVDATDAAATVCKTTNDRCQAELKRTIRHERKLRELEDGIHATHIVRLNVVAACKTETDCVTAEQLKAVVGEYIVEKAGLAEAPAEHGLEFAASKADVDKLFKEFYPASHTSGDSGIESCPVAKEFTFFVVADELAHFKTAKQVAGSLNDDPHNSELTERLKKAAPGMCVFMSDVTLGLTVPSIKAGSFNKGEANNQGKAAVGPAVSIVDKEGKFVTDVQAGEEYTARFENFQVGTVLNGYLINADEEDEKPQELFKDKVAPGPYGTALEHKFTADPAFEGLHFLITGQSKLFPKIKAQSGILTYED